MELTRRQWLAGTGSLIAATSGLSMAWAASSSDRQIDTLGGPAFGTYWRATVPRGSDEVALRRTIEAIVKSVDQSMSPYRAETEISRFNAIKSDKLFGVTRHFQSVVSEGIRVAGLSGGAFDPTVGPLVNKFGFGPIKGDAGASFNDIAVGNGIIGKTKPNVTLDLCGIAKGYALDQIVSALDALGVLDFVIELGGEVFARGSHPLDRPWRIAIESPVSGTRVVQRVVHLDGQALATSGDGPNGYAFAGRRYSHVMAPQFAAPVNNGIASVSVIARSGMQADAFATAIMALGPRKGVLFATRHDVPTLLLTRDRKGIQEQTVAGFRDYIDH